MAAMVRNAPRGNRCGRQFAGDGLRKLKRRGLVVVISDLIDDPQGRSRPFASWPGIGMMIVFHVQDATELDFSFEGPALFRDLKDQARE